MIVADLSTTLTQYSYFGNHVCELVDLLFSPHEHSEPLNETEPDMSVCPSHFPYLGMTLTVCPHHVSVYTINLVNG